MIIVPERIWYHVSAIIGVCGVNFCSFLADTRRTYNSHFCYKINDETTSKILKLNDRVLYGMTGLYDTEKETITSAIDEMGELVSATPEDVLASVLSYLDKHKYEIPRMRNYLVGGKEKSGKFVMFEVHMNFDTYKPEVTKRAPVADQSNYGVSLLLPPKAIQYAEAIMAEVERAITSSTKHDEMLQKAATVIGHIADIDETVNKTIEAVSVI